MTHSCHLGKALRVYKGEEEEAEDTKAGERQKTSKCTVIRDDLLNSKEMRCGPNRSQQHVCEKSSSTSAWLRYLWHYSQTEAKQQLKLTLQKLVNSKPARQPWFLRVEEAGPHDRGALYTSISDF